VQTDADWEQFARNTTLSIYHPMGTCHMGSLENGGVVDKDLKVHGVQGLRIVDASIIPIQPSAHIQTMVYGIAEIAAKKIAGEYQ
jgi:choline dehydrogenase-like flavoprotein